MKKTAASLACLLAALMTAHAVPPQASPVRTVFETLKVAKAVLEREREVLPDKAYNRVLNQLNKAETELEIVKKNAGSHLPAARKAIATAKTEALAAKTDSSHRTLAIAAVDKALEEIGEAIEVKRR